MNNVYSPCISLSLEFMCLFSVKCSMDRDVAAMHDTVYLYAYVLKGSDTELV